MVSSINLSRRNPEHFCKFCSVQVLMHVGWDSHFVICFDPEAAGTVHSPVISTDCVDITPTASNFLAFNVVLSTPITMPQRTRRCACASIGPFLARIMLVNFQSHGEISTEVSTKWEWNCNSSINSSSTGNLLVELLQICIDQSPSSGEFARVKAFFDRVVCTHVIKTIGQNVVPAVNDTFLESWLLLDIVNVASYPVDVARVRWKPRTTEGSWKSKYYCQSRRRQTRRFHLQKITSLCCH